VFQLGGAPFRAPPEAEQAPGCDSTSSALNDSTTRPAHCPSTVPSFWQVPARSP